MLRAVFWLFVAIDAIGIGLWFVLGLAAAGSAKTHPLAVAATLLVLPGAVIAGAIALFTMTQATAWRALAMLVVCAPALVLAGGRITAEIAARHQVGLAGSTPLTRALRALESDPAALPALREALALPDARGELARGEELPLVLAIRAGRTAGPEPLRLLLDAGADPNAIDAFGSPAWFAATGITVDPALLELLLARGADANALGRDGRGGVWRAVDARNWRAATSLLRRGAPTSGRSPMGRSLRETLELTTQQGGDQREAAAVLAAVIAQERGK
jgi:hypothetical protein